ncbi:MAG: VWA domain-containing protein [Rhodospirillales bacterium]|nr:MAG: VWA domain-containing protein [Rhodospirillales bacterium]
MSDSFMRKTLRVLGYEDRGSMMVIGAFALPVMMGGLALAVDTGLWYSEKRKLRQVSDFVSIGAARLMGDGQTLQTARTVAIKDAQRNGFVVDANHTLVVNSPPTTGPSAGVAGKVEVIVTSDLPSAFAKALFGISRTISSRSVATLGSIVQIRNLEVSLMIDVSGSMNGSAGDGTGRTKLDVVKQAAKDLVDTVVQPVQTPYSSRVALVPYSSAVNVSSTYYYTMTGSTSSHWSTVVERTGANKFTDEPPATGGYFGRFSVKKEYVMGAYASSVRNYDSDVPSDSSRIRPLTSSASTVKTNIGKLVSNGSTAGHIGAAWAWYMVSPKWGSIFTGGVPLAYDVTKTHKAVVLLSDFDMNSYYESGNGNSTTQTLAICTAMKAAGVVVYTLGSEVPAGNANAVNLWTNCATSPATRFTANNASELTAAFAAIAQANRNAVFTGPPRLSE